MRPIKPETLDALRTRYHEALATIHDQESITLGVALAPSKMAQNVFDTMDGLRLIVSRERDDRGVVKLHFSASFNTGSQVGKRLETLKMALRHQSYPEMVQRITTEFQKIAEKAFRDISQSRSKIKFGGWSDKMVPHWTIKE